MSARHPGELPQPTEPIDDVKLEARPSEDDAEWLTWRERAWASCVIAGGIAVWVVALVKACGS